MANYEKQPDKLDYPSSMKLLLYSDIQVLDISKCGIDSEGLEKLTYCIGKNNINICKNLKSINFSQNNIASEGAKLLGEALRTNSSIEFLDLSQNKLGVYGAHLIADSLKKNKVIKGLNLFKNNIDVDGARAVRDLIMVNESLEFLDVGHNRIRSKGLEAITEGIA